MTRIVTKPLLPMVGYCHIIEPGTLIEVWSETAIGNYLVTLLSGVTCGISRGDYELKTKDATQ